MRIKALTCENFKVFEKRSFTFGDNVSIRAENFRGKTSIAEAITVALYGVTLTGSPHVDHLIRTGAKKFDVSMIVEIKGEEHEITRVKGGRKTEVYLDGKTASQADVDKLLPDKERFLTVFVPGFFTDKPEREGREMLMNLIKPPSKEEVLAQLAPSDQERLKDESLRNPDELAKEKRAEIKEHEADIHRIEGRIEAVIERLSRVIPQPRTFDATELDALRAQLAADDSGVQVEIAQLQTRSKALGNEYQSLKRQLRVVPAAPYHDGDNCPVCQRELNGEALDSALAHHKSEAADIEAKNVEIVAKMHGLIEEGKQINERLEAIQTKPSADDTATKQRIQELEAEQRTVESHNRDVERMKREMEEERTSIQGLREQIEDLQSRQTRLQEVIRSIGEYRARLAEMQVEQLSKHLNRVSLQLFDVVKSTGEIKPAFHVLYDGKPFKSLSYSERIRANLEFCSLFNKVLGHDIPVYIDNAESITHFDAPAASQLFLATVTKGQELTVESEAQAKGDVA
ncbi:AAA family ATPase [Alicyclobacillus fastidiosus]|uniref:Nuclease SbcCD subunit C n=1 Tax=Alicyclobacillus fastidiosus TaxID=392011 RepID=A0ABV5AKA2_9BACL|nr:AAA family ATPase [Alicyclobacillus fastidiosus]WEH09306.1 AAA family ATPase [Alicyclobacillus fastidiosus]